MRKFSVLIACLCLMSCAAPYKIANRDDYLAEATRIYPSEQKERVIRAAETIIKISDPDDVDMRYVNNGFTALRRYVVYAVIASAAGQERWVFQTEEKDKAIEASLSISEGGRSYGGYTSQPYEAAMNSIPLYRLFWKRMDYMLGRRPDWVTCDQEGDLITKAGGSPTNSLGGLCGPTSQGRDSVPEPMPKVAITASEKASSDRDRNRLRQIGR